MKVKMLKKDLSSFKKYLDGKKRIMTYGAGSWAYDIKKMLQDFGYELDYAIVDRQYCDRNIWGG